MKRNLTSVLPFFLLIFSNSIHAQWVSVATRLPYNIQADYVTDNLVFVVGNSGLPLPDINGLELVSFIKGNPNYKNTPLLIISTEGSERDRAKGLSLGADAYLVKPFSPQDLQSLIVRYLGQEA